MIVITKSLSFKTSAVLICILLILSLSISFLVQPKKSEALSGSSFKAGRIIDDGVFFDEASMTASQIQTFLNSKVPVCDTNGTQMYNSTQTRAQYGASRGNPAPYTCIKSYKQSVPAVTNSGSDLCTGSIKAGTKTAAQIIYDVSRACGINPQVLIVLIQKEQSLITDDWPWKTQYRIATGYGCPDTAPCDSQYYGFFNQVYQAAKAFKRYEANPTSFNYRAKRNNYIYYHPSLGTCGGSTVYIENQATANLYIYTPYQPNQAALNNLYGTGNNCSAYGNRNFWRLFNDWFGSTLGVPFSASVDSRCCNLSLRTGTEAEITLVLKNTGTRTWQDEVSLGKSDGAVMLGTSRDFLKTSRFGDHWTGNNKVSRKFESVLNKSRVKYTTNPHQVKPNEFATFKFKVHVPLDTPSGSYTECFTPFVFGEIETFKEPSNSCFSIKVSQSSFKASLIKRGSHGRVTPNSTHNSFLEFRNDGNVSWYKISSLDDAPLEAMPVMLATERTLYRQSPFGKNWSLSNNNHIASYGFSQVYNSNGTLSSNQEIVKPGQSARFNINFLAPSSMARDKYSEYFRLVRRDKVGSSWKTNVFSHNDAFINLYNN